MEFNNQNPNQFLMVTEETLEKAINKLIAKYQKKEPKKVWVSATEAMDLLTIKSKTTLLEIRQNGDIEYTQPMKKVILYKYESILAYLEKHSRKTF